METSEKSEPICCPKLDPSLWEDKLLTWNDKKFVKASVFTMFYMPVNFGQVMRKLDNAVSAAGATIPDWLCLSDHTSKWNMDVYLAVDKEITGLQNVTLSGNFFCKVYEGSFSDTKKWCDDFQKSADTKGLKIDKWYMWYTTCPKCAKKYGKNYVAVVAKINS